MFIGEKMKSELHKAELNGWVSTGADEMKTSLSSVVCRIDHRKIDRRFKRSGKSKSGPV